MAEGPCGEVTPSGIKPVRRPESEALPFEKQGCLFSLFKQNFQFVELGDYGSRVQ